jgi:Mrp family chromosome partitioning ATPase
MDRIAKALELARLQVPAAEQAAPAREPARPVRPGEVRYTRTRAVAVPADALRARHVSSGHERTPLAEAFKRLRTQVIARLRESGRNALGVSSPRAGEGKTTVALNLAVHAAMEADWTVLLVEADLRRPGLCEALGIGAQPGLGDHLARGAPLETLLLDPGFGRCLLLPAGAPRENSSELLGASRMQELALELRQRYPDRLVIYDLPPLLDAADGIAVLPWVEALLLVVEEGRTAADDVLRAAQVAGDARLIGTVLNMTREPMAREPMTRELQNGARSWWRRLLGAGG